MGVNHRSVYFYDYFFFSEFRIGISEDLSILSVIVSKENTAFEFILGQNGVFKRSVKGIHFTPAPHPKTFLDSTFTTPSADYLGIS